jgi:hypothetical protein
MLPIFFTTMSGYHALAFEGEKERSFLASVGEENINVREKDMQLRASSIYVT